MPLFRFTVRGMMLAVALVASVMGFLATYHERLGCGRQASVSLVFYVVDDGDGRPVNEAKVELFDDRGDPPRVMVMTGGDGSAGAACRARSSSYRGPFLRRHSVFFYSDVLRVEVGGYQPVEGMLRDFTNDPAFRTDRTAYPPILIRMKRESGSGGV